jgi:hypothetical protein
VARLTAGSRQRSKNSRRGERVKMTLRPSSVSSNNASTKPRRDLQRQKSRWQQDKAHQRSVKATWTRTSGHGTTLNLWSRAGVPFRSVTEPTSLAPCYDLCQNVVSYRVRLLASHGVIVELLFQKIIRTWTAFVKSTQVRAVTLTAKHFLNLLGAHVCFKCALPTLGANLPATKCPLADPFQPAATPTRPLLSPPLSPQGPSRIRSRTNSGASALPANNLRSRSLCGSSTQASQRSPSPADNILRASSFTSTKSMGTRRSDRLASLESTRESANTCISLLSSAAQTVQGARLKPYAATLKLSSDF